MHSIRNIEVSFWNCSQYDMVLKIIHELATTKQLSFMHVHVLIEQLQINIVYHWSNLIVNLFSLCVLGIVYWVHVVCCVNC